MASRNGDRNRSLIYIANSRVPSQRTNSLQVMKMCAGFSAAGATTRLVVPFRYREWWRLTVRRAEIWDWYAIKAPFSITSLPYPYLSKRRRMANYALGAALFARYKSPDLVYTRSLLAARWLAAWKQPVVFEAHDLGKERTVKEWRGFVDDTMGRPSFRGLVAISRGLCNAYREAGAPPEKLHVFHDGVDLERFEPALDRTTARDRLGLAQTEQVLCHVGNMSEGRGIDVLLRALTGLSGVKLVLVGGRPEEIERHSQLATELEVIERVLFAGYVSNKLVPLYLWAADVLVLAATAESPIAAYTSPLKLFEYMASGRPLVAAELATIQEVLRQEENALLVGAGDSEALAQGIRRLLAEAALGQKLALQAKTDVGRYSWRERGAAILDAFTGSSIGTVA